MKIRQIVFVLSIVVIISLVYFYFFNTTKIYMGIANPSVIDGIDVTVIINENEPFKDTLYNGLFNYKVKTVNMRWGINEVTVLSNKTKITLKREIFLHPFENIVISFFPPDGLLVPKAIFDIGVIRGNFVYE